MFNKSLKKYCSFIILAIFLITNNLYALPGNIGKDKLRVPLIFSGSNRVKVLDVDTGDSYSRYHADIKSDQDRLQREEEAKAAKLHRLLADEAKAGKIDMIGAISAEEINKIKKLIDLWVNTEEYSQIVFISSEGHVLADAFLQALTATSDWNEELYKKKRPQVFFVDPLDSTDINRLVNSLSRPFSANGTNKVLFVSTASDVNRAGYIETALKNTYGPRVSVSKSDSETDSAMTSLLLAGIVSENYIDDIYKGAKSAYDEWLNIKSEEEAAGYAAYKLASTQIRFAKTGQGISVFMMFSKRLKGFSVWLAQQFNREVGNSKLNILFSGEWSSDHRHSTGQGHVQARGFGYNSSLEDMEKHGFITLTYLSPDADDKGTVIVTGDVNPRYQGYHVNFLRDVDREAQRLACQQADRPIVDVNFSARTPEDLGRFLHFGQVSALMAGRLAGRTGEEDSLEKKINDRTEISSPVTPMEDGKIEITQNILFIKADGKFGGILGEKIQAELDDPQIKEKKMFNLVVKQMARLVGPKGGLDKVIKSVQSGHALVHMDPEQTRKAVDVSEAMAKRFLAGSDAESEVLVAAIGGSVSGDYLMRTLDLKDGPKVTFITDYDEERLGIILEKIRKSPEKIRIVMISKSGVTTETDVNGMAMIETLKQALRAKGVPEDDIKERFLFITDSRLGDLREKVRDNGYISLDHSSHGGRFTMLTELGLFFYFLKGGNKKGLLEALDSWRYDTKKLSSVSKKITHYKSALERKHKEPEQRIEVIKEIFGALKEEPAVMAGFLRTLINTIQQVNPEYMRDTLVGLAVNGNMGQIINPSSPFYQQVNVESLGKPGARIYAVGACGLDGIESLWGRVLSNGRIFVELYGEQRNDTTADDARRLQATWDVVNEELTKHGVPTISVKTGNMGIKSLVEIMRMIYLELAVSAEMYTPMAISSEGQPGVELAKSIVTALMARVNADAGQDLSLRERGPGIPRIPHNEIERIIEVPMDIGHSMSLDSNHSLVALAEKIINNNDAENPGLMTIETRRQIELMDKNKIVEYVRNKLERLIAGEPGVNLVIIDGEAKAGTDKAGGYIVRATSIESVSNLVTGTVTGTSVDFYKKYDSGIKLELTIHFYWGSGSVRAIVSNGLRAQDFILLDEGKVVEASKAGEHNYMQMAGVGDHISFGGSSTGRPEGFQAFEMEVVLESMDFKIRHENSVTPDMYMMMNKQGVMTGWMTWGEAFGVAYIMGAAGGDAMMMTEKGMTHIKDIKITEEMLRSKEKIYVYAGVKNLIQQIQVWMDFLNARSQEGLTGQPVIFRLLDVIGAMPQDAPVLVKANAIMLLLRIKEGLDALPKKTLKGRIKDTVSDLEYKVSEALTKLNTERIIYELKQEYIDMGLEQRKANRDRFVLLGQRDALMRSEVKAGDETIELYELESMFGRIKSWQIMEGILQGLDNDDETFKRIMLELQMNHEGNAYVTAESKTVSLPQSEPGEEFNNYLRDNLCVSEDAIIEPGAAGQVLEQTRQVSGNIMNIYMDPVEIKSDMQADDVQKNIIAELRAREPEVFYIEAGKEYIRSLRWIMRNIHERKTGAVVNISGDVSSRLDFIFNAIFKYALRQHIYAIVSEEDSLIVYGVGANKTKDVDSYRIVLFLDPIDGSSQIKDEGNFGSIFTLGFLRPGQSLEDGTFDARRQVLLDFDLQYGETTQLIVHNPANKDGEDELVEFALHDSLDNGPVFKEELRYKNTTDVELQNLKWEGLLPLPDRENSDTAIHLALGGSLMTDLPEDGDKSMTKWLVKTYGYKQQYTGGLINDIRKIFSGHFVNPNRAGFIHKYGRTGAHREGRLRTSFEGFHDALMARSIGAEVTNERQPLLNIKIGGDSPSKIKCAHYAGSAWIMKLFMSWHDYWDIYRKEKSISSISDEAIDEAFEKFMAFYRTNADRLIREIMEYSNSGTEGAAQKSEMDVRKALLLWDSVDMEENYFPRFLKMTGEQAYKKLFPETLTSRIDMFSSSRRDDI